MSYIHPAALAARRKYWTRHDAWRFAAPGTPEAERPGWLDPSATRVRLKEAQEEEARAAFAAEVKALQAQQDRLCEMMAEINYEFAWRKFLRKYSPSQPRVPAGNPDGGQWTSGANAVGDAAAADSSNEILSDETPDSMRPGAQYAQRLGRGPVVVRIGSRTVSVEGGQAARLVEAQARAESSIARVREINPTWRPTPSAYESVEGLIRAHNAAASEAQARANELARAGIGPGPFARESIEARSPNTDFRAAERQEINRIGESFGCHTCGTLDPGTLSRNFVPDHQPPSACNSLSRQQRLYPQCRWCSGFQGGNVNRLKLGH